MSALFDAWAREECERNPNVDEREYREARAAEMRAEFIAGLEEVRYYRASDGCVSEDFEASSMEEAIAKARESWQSAGEGTYEVTVYEHLTEGGRDEMYRAGATRPTATETITVVAK